jgi:hypothetical protein
MTVKRLRSAIERLQSDEKLQSLAGAIVLAGLATFATAGLKGLLVLGLALLVASRLRPVRQRIRRWYLLG